MQVGGDINVGDIVKLKTKFRHRWELGIIIEIEDRPTPLTGLHRYYIVKTLDSEGVWTELCLQGGDFVLIGRDYEY